MATRFRASTYSSLTKTKIVRYVYFNPGRSGREISKALGLEARRVNSFLWHEGRGFYGFDYRDRGYFANALKPTSPKPPAPEPSPDGVIGAGRSIDEWDGGICTILANMQVMTALGKVRQMNHAAVDQAFQEESYPLLSDEIKIELAMRRADLLAREPVFSRPRPESASARPIMVCLALVLVVLMGALLQQRPGDSPRIDQIPAAGPRG